MRSETKQAERVISLDIGSTYTKAALFQVQHDYLTIEAAAKVPTTTASLKQGVCQAMDKLGCIDASSGNPAYPVFFSSSAKGGLHVVAVGIVPELTLKVAKLTALSAGARVTHAYDYKLTTQNVQEMDRLHPDIILFSGGTDGGNETYVRHNARMLAQLAIRPQIIYAGNRSLREEIQDLLADFPLHFAENILPELDRPAVEDAKQKICKVFLAAIVAGKGLLDVIRWLDRDPLPTPLAVMELVEAIHQYQPQWSGFCLIDMGGATTDFYSCSDDDYSEPGIIYRGLPEPEIKRTVEGDLGIRTNAPSVLLADSETLQRSRTTEELMTLTDYVNKITQQTDYLPGTPQEQRCDKILAEICITQAFIRHAGTRKRVFTEHGQSFVQTGKNLQSIQKIILTGGFLSTLNVDDDLEEIFSRTKRPHDSAGDEFSLIPREMTFFQDKHYLIPLLGNLVRQYPQQAVRTAVRNLKPLLLYDQQPMENTC